MSATMNVTLDRTFTLPGVAPIGSLRPDVVTTYQRRPTGRVAEGALNPARTAVSWERDHFGERKEGFIQHEGLEAHDGGCPRAGAGGRRVRGWPKEGRLDRDGLGAGRQRQPRVHPELEQHE